MSSQTGILKIMSGERRDACAAAVRAGLSLIEPGYRSVVTMRNRRFDSGSREATKLARPVISVGNLTTGGTGKTPMVIDLCQRLIKRGHVPGVLLRGYGGDEAIELTAAIGQGGEVEPYPDRVAGAAAVLQRREDVDVFLLDDGFQHRQVARDFDLVLIDATNPWGYDHVLPRGLMREPKQGLQRANAVVVTRADRVSLEALENLDAEIEKWHGKAPLAHAATRWSKVMSSDGEELSAEQLQDRKFAAVCGLGNPDVFFNMLEDTGARLMMKQAFMDHVAYDAATVHRLEAVAKDAGAMAWVMTEKDWVKWRQVEDRTMVVYRPQVSVAWLNGQIAIERRLERLFKPGATDAD